MSHKKCKWMLSNCYAIITTTTTAQAAAHFLSTLVFYLFILMWKSAQIVRSHESNKKQKFVSQKNAIDCEEEEDVKS
jgi:hypothetical protein